MTIVTQNKKKITAIFIAYYAEKTVEEFYRNFPKELFDDIILVDDASKDRTFEIAKRIGIPCVFKNPVNLGYGGNMKKTIDVALSRGADVIVDIHPDGEYLPSAIKPALQKIEAGAKFVLGNRFAAEGNLIQRGMYFWKIGPIVFLNWLARVILREPLSDFHQGFRVYTKELLKSVQYHENSANYLFSFELIAQAAFKKIKIAEVPVETRYEGEKRGASLKSCIIYSLGVSKVLGLYILAKLGIKISLFK